MLYNAALTNKYLILLAFCGAECRLCKICMFFGVGISFINIFAARAALVGKFLYI